LNYIPKKKVFLKNFDFEPRLDRYKLQIDSSRAFQ
jgi:hypothetical protein